MSHLDGGRRIGSMAAGRGEQARDPWRIAARRRHEMHGGCGAEQAPSRDWLGGAVVERGLGRRCESSNRHGHGRRWARDAGRRRENGTTTRRRGGVGKGLKPFLSKKIRLDEAG
jgi:hypothetical protein